MDVDPARLQAFVNDFAHDDGRSVYAMFHTPRWSWSGGAHADVQRPAASLHKLLMGMAVEPWLDELRPQRVGDLLRETDSSILHALGSKHVLTPREIHALMLSASDAASARWVTSQVGIEAIVEAAISVGAHHTQVVADAEFGALGQTTARDAVAIMHVAANDSRYPACARALRHSIINSRIPLGATSEDIDIAHKTGTLTGVAHDVAQLTCSGGTVWLAFLSTEQHDTLVTGYEMGLCTRRLLEYAGLTVTSTSSVSTRP